jgi:PiT family inorganic phosphate transporter
MWHLLGGVYLGWSLGANDTANVFGTAVTSRMVRFSTAAILSALFVCLGAFLEGEAGIETLSQLSIQDLSSATMTAVAAGITITIMTWLRIPSSASQAVVGAILGVGLLDHNLNLSGLPKVILCWIGTPIGGILVALILYRLSGWFHNWVRPSLYTRDSYLRIGLILAGSYGAYALGANNVANVTGVYAAAGIITPMWATLIGGASIGLGVFTYSRPVMKTVGKSIMKLDAFSALIVVLAEAITVHFYAWVGVPVSTSQAVVGAVIGVGLIKQATAIRNRVVVRISIGWVVTPIIAFGLALAMDFISHLQYIP